MSKIGTYRAKSKDPANAGGKGSGVGCLIVFGLIFGGMGLLFTVFIARDFLAEAKTRGWAEVPAELIRSEIRVEEAREDAPFLLEVEYRYRFGDQTQTSTRYGRKEEWTDDYEKLALKRASFLQGDGAVVCYVNPENQAEAVLKRGSLWSGLLILFPLLFVLIGGVIVWAGLASLRKEKKASASTPAALSSSPTAKSRQMGPLGAAIFFFIFFAIGLGLLFPLAILPFRRAQDAKSWVATPCEILWSRVQSHDSDDGTTYSVDIFFQYEFGGATHRSNRYSFASGSSSGHSSKAAIVKRYPRGSRQTCHVDPAQPERAVLERDAGAIGFWFLIPALFAFIGLVGLVATVRSALAKRKANPLHAATGTTAGTPSPTDSGPLTLKPAKSRFAAFLGITFVALFWNGIVSIFLFAEDAGPSGLFGFVFMTPFVLVGLALIAGVLYTALGLFNPGVELVLTPGQPRLGEKAHLAWRLKGSPSRLRSLKILLVGTETATYQRGTNSHTDREAFYAQILADETSSLGFYQGENTFQIPHDLMYSFGTGNNGIEWEIRIIGEIRPGPDIADTSKIELLPAARA